MIYLLVMALNSTGTVFSHRMASSYFRSGVERPRQHTPHGLRRLTLGGTGDVGIGVQGESCGKVAQHPGHRFHIHPILQGQGGEVVSDGQRPPSPGAAAICREHTETENGTGI